ncbi:MAG: Glutamine--scyllo-inositol transaminase [Verrucomicrobia bacterium]|nr:Glutamine--scyllo-inositol transaminase [Verrucomicrobiota bacterium]
MGLGECLLGATEARNVARVMRHGALFRYYGPGALPSLGFATRFERAVARMHRCKYALGVTSGTAALEVALGALGVGPGDEVILPVWSWVSCFTAIVRVGAKPVLAEVDDSLNLDPAEIERLTTPATRGVLVVHYQGVAADMDEIMQRARRNKLWVLEDCAESLGATYKGKRVGTMGDIATYSFQQRKVITTGEGGMVLTQEGRLYERAVRMSDIGQYRDEHRAIKAPEVVGFSGSNYRMTELAGAVGCAQFARVLPMIRHLRRLRAIMQREVGALPGLAWRKIADPSGDLGFDSYFFLPTHEQALALKAAAQKRGVSLAPHTGTYCQYAREYCRSGATHTANFSPFPTTGAWPAQGYREEDFPRTSNLVGRMVSVPLGARFSAADAAHVGKVIREELGKILA